ncbi:hypothetical protein, partial [Halorussus aquaticus]
MGGRPRDADAVGHDPLRARADPEVGRFQHDGAVAAVARFDERPGAGVAGLLAHRAVEDDRPVEVPRLDFGCEVPERQHGDGETRLHVGAPAAVERAVLDDSGEGVAVPPLGVARGHHVEVTVEDQRGTVGVVPVLVGVRSFRVVSVCGVVADPRDRLRP